MPTTDHWERLFPLLQQALTPDDFEVWFSQVSARSTARALTLTFPGSVHLEYVRDHYLDLLRGLLGEAAGRAIALHLVALSATEPSSQAPPKTTLNSRYTFTTYVTGPSNQFARAAASSVADNPGRAYNPLFLYGGSGLGKTHLLHAIGNEIQLHQPQAQICYVPTEHFVNELITSIRLQRMAEFRDSYRTAQVLLLDDVHILAGKERTQEEFFHTFNSLHEAGHQIVLTSDTAPDRIQGLEERLRSRFVWGLVADIQPPDLETKCAILRAKAHSEAIELPDAVVLFLARRVRENVRELEGLLNRLIVYSSLTAQPPTLETAKAALSSVLPDERTVTPADIIRFTAHHYGIKVADIKGRDNRRSVAFPRQVAMYLLREVLELSFPEIAKLFGKHHSTVMYSVDAVARERRSNPSLDSTLTTFVEHFR
ncbi:MAG: chromosomal replication initiator protein DnaA [Acidobacteria bacterium]|nr:chromosomal replication initiator protein DnaA [Acidobacteriota bacterium]